VAFEFYTYDGGFLWSHDFPNMDVVSKWTRFSEICNSNEYFAQGFWQASIEP